MTDLETRLAALEARLAVVEQIEAIRHVRERYCLFVDAKRWDDLEGILTSDFVAYSNNFVGASWSTEPVASSARQFRERVEKLTVGATTVHVCMMPDIRVESATTATGSWAMTDVVTHPTEPGMRFVGRGHYRDEYRFEDGVWRLAKATLTRQTLDPLPLPEAPAVVGQPAAPSPRP